MFKLIHIPTLMEVLSESDCLGSSLVKLFKSESAAKDYIEEFKDSFYNDGNDRYIICLEDYF